MDPLLAFAAEFWWVGPVVIGGGAASVAGIRAGRTRNERNLEVAAAKYELEVARHRVRTAKADQKRAEALILVAKSDRQSGRPADVDAARRRLADAQREFRAAQTELRGRRAQVQAARTMLQGGSTPPEHLPLPRLVAAHDAVIARWMAYETDPARAIAFPAMIDAKDPATAALITAMDRARWLRPKQPRERITAEQFAHYRASVTEFEVAFEAAEVSAWRRAGAGSPRADRARPVMPTELREVWNDWLQTAKTSASAALTQAAEAAMEAVRSRTPAASPWAPQPTIAQQSTPAPRPGASPATSSATPQAAATRPGASPTASPPPSASAQTASTRHTSAPTTTPPSPSDTTTPPSPSDASAPPGASPRRIWPVPGRPGT